MSVRSNAADLSRSNGQVCASATERTISERQEVHLPLPFAFEAALGQENQVVDNLSDRGNGRYLEAPWHRLTRCNSLECVLRQRRDIVRDEDAPLVGGHCRTEGSSAPERPTS